MALDEDDSHENRQNDVEHKIHSHHKVDNRMQTSGPRSSRCVFACAFQYSLEVAHSIASKMAPIDDRSSLYCDVIVNLSIFFLRHNCLADWKTFRPINYLTNNRLCPEIYFYVLNLHS